MKRVKDERVLKAISGQYDWRISDVMKEAWKRVKGSKAPYWGAFCLFFAVVFGISFVLGFIGGILHVIMALIYHGQITREALVSLPAGASITLVSVNIIFRIITFVLILSLSGGMFFIALRNMADKTVNPTMIFRFFKLNYMLRFLGLFLLLFFLFIIFFSAQIFLHEIASYQAVSKLMFAVFYVLLIAVFMYFMTSTVLTVPLMVDRDYGPWAALVTSFRAVRRRWFKTFALIITCWFITVISLVLFLVGFIWAYPFFKNVIAILYRETFGIVGLAIE